MKTNNYSKKLLDPRWQKKRLLILQRDDFKCHFCNDDKATLHIHHINYLNNPWDAKNSDLTTLCKHCHSGIHYLEKEFALNFNDIKSIKKKNLITDSGIDESVTNLFILTDKITSIQIYDNDIELLFVMTLETVKDIYNICYGRG